VRFQIKALFLSIAVHSVVIMMLFSHHNSSVNSDRLLVIDFTMGNDMVNGEKKEHSKTKLKPLFVSEENKEKVKHHIAEEKVVIPKPQPETVMPIPSPAAAIDKQMPIATYDQETASGKDIHNITGDVSMVIMGSKGGSSGTATAKTGIDKVSYGYGGSSLEQEKLRYLKEHFVYIKDMVQKNITYPEVARNMGWEGKVIVSFVIASDGMVKNIRVVHSSGKEILDRNSVETIKNSSPFPKPPVEAQIIIPIQYSLH
jgi:protein TonB